MFTNRRVTGLLTCTLVTLATSTIVACATWARMPLCSTSFVERTTDTVENHNPYDDVVRVSSERKEWRLGKLRPGDRGMFALPAEVAARSPYYLVADRTGSLERVVWDPVKPTQGVWPYFEVGRFRHTSYVRFLPTTLFGGWAE